MVEDLRRFPYFHTFCFGVALVKENGISEVNWLDIVGIYLYAKIAEIFRTV